MRRSRHEVFTLPDSRIGTIDFGRIVRKRHRVIGRLEVDVTELLAGIRSLRNVGPRLTIFACITKRLALRLRRIERFKGVPAVRFVSALVIRLQKPCLAEITEEGPVGEPRFGRGGFPRRFATVVMEGTT